jgi:hypothetical protein
MRDKPSDYEDRYGAFLVEIRRDFDEYANTRVLTRAIELSQATGQHLNHDQPPQFFTGDLDAEIVLVHLNPKDDLPTIDGSDPFAAFDDYFDAHRYFGERMYGPSSPRTHRSPFDLKQIRFLRELGVIDFVEERTEDDKYTNLQRVIDDKLQFELVPYSSQTFTVTGFTTEVLQPHLDRIMAVIATAPRRYVLFCGVVFQRVLSNSIIEQHTFRLQKKDGQLEKQRSRFANLEITYNGETIRAGLCHTWPRQGIPMPAYGREVARRY